MQTAVADHLTDNADARYDSGCAYRTSGQLDLAEACLRRALAIDPAHGRAALALGQICYDLGRTSESLHYLEQALQSEPQNPDALCSCGLALADAGHTDLALQFLRRAIENAPDALSHRLAAIGVLETIEFNAEYPWYEQFMVDCLDDPRLPRAALANVATSLLWIKPAMRDALSADPLDSLHIDRLAHEPLFLRLLSGTVLRSWAFEEFFTRLRRFLSLSCDPRQLDVLACVAEQAFNTGYVQHQSDAEAALELELLKLDAASLTPVEIMVLASYRALADVPDMHEIAQRQDLPESTDRVIRRTLLEPLREREIESRIRTLTPIHNTVSIRVRAQYEEHPYPRWIGFQSLSDRTERLVDDLERHALNFNNPGWPERPKVLVPGCGTGYHPLALASRYPETDVLAVDLSRTSLAYAVRKQEELSIANVKFGQADLLGMADWADQFEYIDCAGVLHHMESPLDGWRVLCGLLKPGGVMRIGLYSEIARRTIVAARAKIAELGIPSTPSAIRDFRQAIMRDPEFVEIRSLASTAGDFFSMGEIRDLIFHVQEHRFDLPMIKQHFETLGLEFGGFVLSNRNVVRDFQKRFSGRAQWLNLDCWAEFETLQPHTFHTMYQFYCLRPALEIVSPTSHRLK
jgi:SAM-dependent methyltransferase